MRTPVDPADHQWLKDLAWEAGCITVVGSPDSEAVAGAFGARPEVDPSTAGRLAEEGTEIAHVASLPGAVVIGERDGYQGSRPDVLKAASKAAGKTVAASVCWDVDGATTFTLVRRGRLVCSLDLDQAADDEATEKLSGALRRLIAQTDADDPPLRAIGAAMVVTATGVALRPEHLHGGRHHPLEPPITELETDDPEYAYLQEYDPELYTGVLALSDDARRELARTLARYTATEAGVTEIPIVAETLAALDAGATEPPRGLDRLVSRWDRERHALVWRDDIIEVPVVLGRLDTTYAVQRAYAGEALRYAFHPHAYTAATRCAWSAQCAAEGSRTTRHSHFVYIDGSGYVSTWLPGPKGHEAELRAALLQMLTSPEHSWPAIMADLPAPLTDEQRAQALLADEGPARYV